MNCDRNTGADLQCRLEGRKELAEELGVGGGLSKHENCSRQTVRLQRSMCAEQARQRHRRYPQQELHGRLSLLLEASEGPEALITEVAKCLVRLRFEADPESLLAQVSKVNHLSEGLVCRVQEANFTGVDSSSWHL